MRAPEKCPMCSESIMWKKVDEAKKGFSVGKAAVGAVLLGPIGLVGGVLAALAYPMYNIIVKRERKKLAPEIIRLTDELMK